MGDYREDQVKRGSRYAANAWIARSKVPAPFLDRLDEIGMHALSEQARAVLREAFLAGVRRQKEWGGE